MLTPKELTQSYRDAGVKKSNYPALKLIVLAILSGSVIAMGGASSTLASYAMENAGLQKLVQALVFPCGLCTIILCGLELFTSNCLISMGVMDKKTTIAKMFRNLSIVYLGNCFGAFITSAMFVYTGKFSGDKLAYYIIKTGVAKASITLPNAIILGIFCNILVCLAVFCAASAKDTTGKCVGAYIPIILFILCGFEHSIANMYYVPSAIMVLNSLGGNLPEAVAHMDLSNLNYATFITANLIPVTIGNLIGGVLTGAIMWYNHGKDDHTVHH